MDVASAAVNTTLTFFCEKNFNIPLNLFSGMQPKGAA